ncbi:hypothetical protein [Euzebya rosea]|uniref:hypothetical protein n=1 Tax=Euzebya rosea TaxID=2052804 RepID=UPI000D3EC25D|nr:hypothetical protein [Euzebya rosea]
MADRGDAAPERRCTGCGRVLPLEAFAWKDRARGQRQPRCRSCTSAAFRGWYEENADSQRARTRRDRAVRHRVNDQLIQQAKDVPCADCGGRFRTEEMDFDHVRGDKSFDIANGRWQVSVETLEQEMAKCEVVCAVCHRLRTRDRRR